MSRLGASAICCVKNCNSTRQNTILHKFPNPDKDPLLFRTWINAIGANLLMLEDSKVYKMRYVCHKHFEPKYYTRSKYLAINAVPRLHLKESHYEAEEEPEVWAESESAEAAEVLSCEECGQDADSGGKLYQCVECPRVVCAACEREERHRQHCLLRLPSRAVYDKLRTLYESLRDTVTAQLADDDEHSVPKEDPILEPNQSETSNKQFLQECNDYPKQVETRNSKRIFIKVPSSVKTGSELILIKGAESLPTPRSVPAAISVPIAKSVTEPKSVPKLIFESRLPKPKSVHELISDRGPLMLNLPGDHGHRYTVISTGAAKWSCSEKAKRTTGTEGFESTTTAKRKKPQKEDEEHLYMEGVPNDG